MPLQITMCRLCTQSRPEFRQALALLLAHHAACLEVVELDCMAACEDVPAVMVGYDYHPQMTPNEFVELIRSALETEPNGN